MTTRQQRLHGEFSALHRALIDEERREYELVHGQVSAGTFLHALVNEAAFEWLRPMTKLLAELGEGAPDGETLSTRLRALLRVDHEGNAAERRYSELFERSPDVAYAHAATLHALRS